MSTANAPAPSVAPPVPGGSSSSAGNGGGGVLRLTPEQANRAIAELQGHHFKLSERFPERRRCGDYLPDTPNGFLLTGWLHGPSIEAAYSRPTHVLHFWNDVGDEEIEANFWAAFAHSLPNYTGNIAAAWPLFTQIQAALKASDDAAFTAFDAIRPQAAFTGSAWLVALLCLSPHFICCWWLSMMLRRPVEIHDGADAGAGEEEAN